MNQSSTLKRFWDHVSFNKDQDGFKIYLDQHVVRLPQKSVLVVSQEALAKKIVEEWRLPGIKKGESFSLNLLPITRIVGTLIEKIKPQRHCYIDALIPYVNGELLCYRAEKPKQLVKEQNEKWQPLLQWAEQFFNVSFETTYGVMPITQNSATIQNIKNYLSALSDEALTYFAISVPLLGSIVLPTAIKEKQLSVESGFSYAYLDEKIQSEIWGYDSEQQQKLDQIKQEIQECCEFLDYL